MTLWTDKIFIVQVGVTRDNKKKIHVYFYQAELAEQSVYQFINWSKGEHLPQFPYLITSKHVIKK